MRSHFSVPVCAVLAILCATPLPAAAFARQQYELPAPAAWDALDRGDAEKAAAIFREELERSPRNAMLHYGAGYAASLLGRRDAAISSLKKAIELNPRFVQAMILLAQVAYAATDLDLAIRSLEQASKLLPRDRRIAAQLEEWRKEAAVHNSLDQRPGVRFRVLFEGAEEKAISDRIAGVLESAYWDIGKTLNSYPSQTLTVVLYTNRQFQDITRAPAWAGGGFDGLIRLPVGNALRSPRALDRVVTHEFVHAVIANAAPRGVPTWVNEGLASYFEGGDRTWATRLLRSTRTRLAIEDLSDNFGRFDGNTALIAYAESFVGAQLLYERLGAGVGVFLQMIGAGQTVNDTLTAFKVSPEAFYREWRRRMGFPSS